MKMPSPQDIAAEAVDWHIRLRNGGAPGDWEAFIRWLEADPARSAAYDAVKLADAAIEPEMIRCGSDRSGPAAAFPKS